MDGMLSQDEINALLSGMAADGDTDASSDGADAGGAPAAASAPIPDAGGGDELTDFEKDAIGEVANISMGTSATTLYSLVNRKVDITTPEVTMSTWGEIVENYEKPCVFIQIHYKAGLDGYNMLILREDDVKIITDLMMGGDGTNTDGELGELHLSAISEAMNQMMGSSATSLSSMLGRMIDISPPEASLVDLTTGDPSDYAEFLTGRFVKIAFRMQIGDLVDSSIMQLYPTSFAKELYDHFIGSQEATSGAASPPPPEPEPAAAPPPPPAAPAPDPGMAAAPPPQMGYAQAAPPPQMGYGAPQMGYGAPPQMGYGQPMGAPVNVQQAQFTTFSNDINPMQPQENIELIKDVPLEVTVELGRTRKSINDILDFSPGTIIELDKIAGEPIDVLVNGKNVAKGEVVVIDESFGVRVTEIIK
ncbi:MAG: flagellar motor switch phosphatase FliY [Lachnospiraceae bacterium]|nr:flagellar motor switch phosphatase FliY [Lachnospiraceae bacterium]